MRNLGALGIIAADVDASLAFYCRLGLQFTALSEGRYPAAIPNGFRLLIDSAENIESFFIYTPSISDCQTLPSALVDDADHA